MADWTKTNYREYIASEAWRSRRRDFLGDEDSVECNRCGLPRWLHRLIYDQDIHVHHKSYARIGQEKNSDLEALCARCHDIESTGNTVRRDIKPSGKCFACGVDVWHGSMGYQQPVCMKCERRIGGVTPDLLDAEMIHPEGWVWWEHTLRVIASWVGPTKFAEIVTDIRDNGPWGKR